MSLATAITFGGAVNLLLVSATLWPDVLPPAARACAWLAIGGAGIASAWRTNRILPDWHKRVVDDRGLFPQAQAEYLRGHWLEAESLLQNLRRESRDDVEAQLLWATLLRRTKRFDEAETALDALEQLEAAEPWRWEMNSERRLLRRERTTEQAA